LGFVANSQVTSATDIIPAAMSDSIKRMKDGKLRFYFRADYKLTSPLCASLYREASFDSVRMVFNGPFSDYRSDGLLVVESTYKNGKLDGHFMVRYMNGNTWQKGTYKEDMMTGTWEYFYPDGSPMYTFEVKGNVVLLQNVWDQEGRMIVKDGKGRAKISHYSVRSDINENETIWRGQIKNGLAQGPWRLYIRNEFSGIEEVYSRGKYVKGYENGKLYNTTKRFLIGQEQALLNAEELQVSNCDFNPTNDLQPRYRRGSNRLIADLHREIDKISYGRVNSGIAQVSFDVDENGNLGAFQKESEIGVEEFLIEALKSLGPWLPATRTYKPVKQRLYYNLIYYNKEFRNKNWYRKEELKAPQGVKMGKSTK